MDVLEVQLSNGGVTLVETSDAYKVLPFTWWRTVKGYAVTQVYLGRVGCVKKRANIMLHRWVLCLPLLQVDHINRNRLDNRRSNLRLATGTQNNANMRSVGGMSCFKGVCFRSDKKRIKRWQSCVNVGGRKRSLGNFRTQLEAALAYDDAAKELWGEYAALNFPERHRTALTPTPNPQER